MPDFSIIVPVKNGAKFSPLAIQSVLNQNVDVEILWISKIDPQQFGLNMPQIFWHFEEHTGVSNARNTGLKHAKGEFLGFLDVDDQYADNVLVEMAAVLRLKNKLGAVFGWTQYVFDRPKWRQIYRPDHDDIVKGPIFGAGVWKTELARKVGSFDPKLSTGEDIDWLNKANHMNLISETIPKVVLHKRIHGDNLTLQADQIREDLLLVAMKSISRKRIVR